MCDRTAAPRVLTNYGKELVELPNAEKSWKPQASFKAWNTTPFSRSFMKFCSGAHIVVFDG